MCYQCENRPTTSNVKVGLININHPKKEYWKAISMNTNIEEYWFDHEPTEDEKRCLPECFIFKYYL